MDPNIRRYLSNIGRVGGSRSKRKLDPVTARNMVKIREARRAFRNFYASCFWSFDPHYSITLEDVPWVAEQLMKNGGHAAWKVGERLCR
ncbi:MAG: hypothetical protein GX589_02190 [Deltaproteobacteria bacterium]|nr:hypothetical protein [Deltaproteobacteria bacterium]